MWRILNKLFGWDYIVWGNTCAGGVARIQKDMDGVPYYWQYKSTGLLGKRANIKLWLTCEPAKYSTKDRHESKRAEYYQKQRERSECDG